MYNAVYSVFNTLEQLRTNCTVMENLTNQDFCQNNKYDMRSFKFLLESLEFRNRLGLFKFAQNTPQCIILILIFTIIYN